MKQNDMTKPFDVAVAQPVLELPETVPVEGFVCF